MLVRGASRQAGPPNKILGVVRVDHGCSHGAMPMGMRSEVRMIINSLVSRLSTEHLSLSCFIRFLEQTGLLMLLVQATASQPCIRFGIFMYVVTPRLLQQPTHNLVHREAPR